MADRDKTGDKDQNAFGDGSKDEQARKKSADDNEWLRDQVGENTNLSGSTTYRTLPDQPENEDDVDDDSERDTKDRQSNR